MPKPLPSGLKTFEASDTVMRAAQNENIEATDALFHASTGHRHTGKAGDAPQIGKEGLANGAVIADKLGTGAVVSEKIADGAVNAAKVAKGSIDRQHLRQGDLSSNIAKYKKVTVTGGLLTGNPTTPYTFQWGSPGDNHMWELAKEAVLPKAITINLGKDYQRLEGFSFGSWVGSDLTTVPKGFYVEVSNDGTIWTKVYEHTGAAYAPFTFVAFASETNGTYVRLTVTEHGSSGRTAISCLAVYSRFHGNTDLDPLEDVRSWGLNARVQGLMIIPEGEIKDFGGGKLGIYRSLIVMNPAAGTYFRVNPGTYQLPEWGYLYVDVPYRHAQWLDPKIGTWVDGDRGYDNKDRIVIAQRSGSEDIFMNSTIKAKIAGTFPDADKVDGIDFRTNNGYLEFNDAEKGWTAVSAVKRVQRGYVQLFNDGTWPDGERYVVTINAVNVEKSFINVTQTGYTNGSPKYNAGIRGQILNSTQIEIVTMFTYVFDQRASWEVIEYV
ncbi:discoidin domain-containing protein [Paenibacillus sp. M1]|uniref:Discoidin domain-containing protein n=1 Tax=Paenibacillus haidiansis TaxID=1574488 RepID=A0ABU7VUN5_9BACL